VEITNSNRETALAIALRGLANVEDATVIGDPPTVTSDHAGLSDSLRQKP
jgi:hypothetical protein